MERYIRENAYALVKVQEGNSLRTIARFSCSECTSKLDIRLRPGKNPAEAVMKTAQKRGWDYKGRWTRWFCPNCIETSAATHDVTPDADIPAAHPRVPSGHGPTAPAKKAKPGAIEPSGPQWHAVLTAFEVVFDREESRYLDGYTDAKVAQEIDVPVSIVKYIREQEFGELKVDPAIADILKSVDFLKEQVSALAAESLSQKKEIAELRERLDDAALDELTKLRREYDAVDLPELAAQSKELKVQVNKDVPQLGRQIRQLAAMIENFNIPGLDAGIAGLQHQLGGEHGAALRSDISELRKEMATLPIPAIQSDIEELSGLMRAMKPAQREQDVVSDKYHWQSKAAVAS